MKVPLPGGWPRSDLPMDTDSSRGFLCWLVAMMVFLAALGIAGALGLNTVVERWSSDLTGTLTIQVPTAQKESTSSPKSVARVERILRLLRSTPGVTQANAIPRAKLTALLEPWLGSRDLIADLPTPNLINVDLAPGNRPALDDLARRLQKAVPGTSIDDHQIWMSKMVALASGLRTAAWGVVILVAMTTTTTVIYTTRTALAVHRPHIEVLHLVGAADGYIANQFALRSFWLGFLGGLVGLTMAIPTLWGIGQLTLGLKGSLLLDLSPQSSTWAVLSVLPLLAAGIAMVTAHYTVQRQLACML